MGGGAWSAATYTATTDAKVKSGSTFGYSATTRSAPTSAWKAHEKLDPKVPNATGDIIRESRDSTEHPNSTPVAVFFDHTGSMGGIPVVVQTKLANLFGLLMRKGYAEDPQVLVGAYGDGKVDEVPLQVSQFESDNRIDDNLDLLFLERGGGGNFGESMDLAWYFLAHHTSLDSFEKHGKKGYAFFIGDEVALGLTENMVRTYIVGNDGAVAADLSHKGTVAKLLETYEAYVLLIDNGSAKMQGSQKFYTDLFGEDRVLIVQDENAIAETIALTVGMIEGSVDLDEGIDDLKSVGASSDAIASASAAVAVLRTGGSSGSVVEFDAPEGLDSNDPNVRV